MLAVIGFHGGVPGFSGGFVGVDVFFVISGYLITSIIQGDLSAGRFGFRHFYERRFRRIAPAMLTVCLATTVGSFWLLLPYELVAFGKSAVATVTMGSNLYFWRAADYFAVPTETLPLLHSWSLGVEEQFYLLFPAVLVLGVRFRSARLFVAAPGVASLLLCVVMTLRTPAAAFYLLPTRGWELMAGAALAQGTIGIPEPLRRWSAAAGLLLIAISCLVLSAGDPFPSWRAMLPVAAAVMVMGADRQSAASRLLRSAPCVGVGRISYSLYLWHWPIFVFLRHWRAELVLPLPLVAGGVAAALLLSLASYRWIEQPARRTSTPFALVLFPCLAAAAVVLGAAVFAIQTGGVPQRLPPRAQEIAKGNAGFAPLAHRCTSPGVKAALITCRIGPAGPAQLLLWGDSHAAAISEGVASAISKPGILISMGSCPPVLNWPKGEDREGCPPANAQTLELAKHSPRITTVVLSAYWLAADREAGARFWQAEQRIVDQLVNAGKTVVVVAGVPDPGTDVPWSSALRAWFGRPPPPLRCPKPHVPLQRVILVDVSEGFCRYPVEKLFSDDNHPSRFAGLTIIAPALRQALGERGAGRHDLLPGAAAAPIDPPPS